MANGAKNNMKLSLVLTRAAFSAREKYKLHLMYKLNYPNTLIIVQTKQFSKALKKWTPTFFK